MSFLSIKNLCKQYNNSSRLAVNNLNFEIRKGETLGLLGVNGSGKTTFSSILATLLSPTSGDILVNGKSIYSSINDFRKLIGYCPQKPNLHPMLTVEENLYYDAIYFGFSEEQARAKVQELLQRFELEKYRDADVATLSGGYQQRVVISRALMHDPEIIILDEPTVGLDPSVRRTLWNIIKSLKKTVLLTTHYLDEADYLSDRVCLMDRGQIMLIDTPQNLKDKHNDSNLENIFIELTNHSAE